jgi:hypothetical protein
MSRYDGLIIPRSYSEYINKTDAATLSQALQLSGVLSNNVAAGDNKAVKSGAVNETLQNYNKKAIFANHYVSGNDIVIQLNGFGNNDQLHQFYWLTMGNGGRAQLGSFLYSRTTRNFESISISPLDTHQYTFDKDSETLTINTGDTAYYGLITYIICN